MAFELNPLRTGGKRPAGVLNIAHRGARAFAPENTLAAFEKAKRFGCQMFELDVRLSKDGELIVHHDEQLTRCTDAGVKFPGRSSYAISDFTCNELRQLDAGSWYIEQLALPASRRHWFLQGLTEEEIEQFVSAQDLAFYASGEIRLPTLQEALELALHEDLMVNIELKALPRMYPGIAEATAGLVKSLDMENRVLISSFDHEQLVSVRRLSENIATGVLTGDRLAKPGAYLALLDADAYHPGTDSVGLNSLARKLDPCGIIDVLASGRAVNVWTCNDKDEMRQLIAAGVTGVISDFPNRVRDVLQE
ncbi:glycerophosphodiester phosphodiesterase [Methylobacter sp. YRD-M1]|uniref:glycerophosphodiester phosphodiesterase n=1 Tax=Methylobacter sp. YRD-M1 TaxID=2911520 RepID=UPI00227C466D|nr:glycerophosphodiester phosphodiesterase family protein [Methylobacter sp. YRD-M1]WAK01119.1 glycerophosphodiester phosphodiesterase [Methylobacter sp. YRD-M1]